METIDTALISRAQSGDQTAQEKLYRVFSGFVYTNALRVTGSVTEAEEVTQDTFIKAFTHIKSFKGDAAFSTWLYRIAFNESLTRLRRFSPFRSRQVDFEQALRVADSQGSPDRYSEQSQQRQHIAALLEQLPPLQRACIVLGDMEGYAYAEIADILELNINTIKTYIRRGRKKMLSFITASQQQEVVV